VLDNLVILTERIHALENKTVTAADSLNQNHEINSPDTSSDEHIDDVTETATAKTLQRDKTLSKKLRQRLSQLELLGDASDCDSETELNPLPSKGKKSGRAKTVHDIIIKDIDWPHFHVYRGSDRKPASFEDLSIPEFVYGFTTQMSRQRNEKVRELMSSHLSMLMRDAIDFPWVNVRNFHGVFLAQMEMDRVAWDSDTIIQTLRLAYVLNAPRTQIPHKNDKDGDKQMCVQYQDGKCIHDKGHKTSRGYQHHACAHCFNVTGNTYSHPLSECRRKNNGKQDSKNGGTCEI